MATEGIIVTVEGEGKETVGAESLPAAIFADGEGSRATAVMEDEGLMVIIEIVLDATQKLVRKIAVFGEILMVF